MASYSSLSDQFDSRGFVPGVFRGARSFRINSEGFLTGIVFRQVWTVGVNEAECRHQEHQIGYYWGPTSMMVDPVRLPDDHGMDVCRHGFYAYAENSNDYHQPGFVSGVIEGYGKEVMCGTRGFRASKAVIVALCVSEVRLTERHLIDLVPGNYPGVPFFDTFEEMTFAFPPDKGEPSD